MELRNQPGTVLDRVFYRNESFVVEKAGEPRAAIVPVREYERMQKRRREARERVFAMMDEMRKRVASSGKSAEEVQQIIDEAIEEVRNEKREKQPNTTL